MEPAASLPVRNGTAPRLGWGSRPTAAPRDLAAAPLPPQACLPLAASPTSPARPVSSRLPAPGLTSGLPRPRRISSASRRPRRSSLGCSPSAPNFQLAWAPAGWALLSARLFRFTRGVCDRRGNGACPSLAGTRAGRSLRPCCGGGSGASRRGRSSVPSRLLGGAGWGWLCPRPQSLLLGRVLGRENAARDATAISHPQGNFSPWESATPKGT